MNEHYYELIDERVYEKELDNGLRLFIILKRISKHLLHIRRNLVPLIVNSNHLIKMIL